MNKSTLEREFERLYKQWTNSYILESQTNYIFQNKYPNIKALVLSAKEQAKKEILKEINEANKKHNYRILGSFYDGLEKAKQIIKDKL